MGRKRFLTIAAVLVLTAGCVSPGYDRAVRTVEVERHVQAVSRKLPELGRDPVLADYLGYAALNNPGLEAAFNRWEAAVERVPQAVSMPDPMLSYTHFIEEVETRVGSQEFKVGLSQKFPLFGKLSLRGDVAAQAASAEGQRFQAAKLKLFYRVKHAYYEYYYLGRAIAVTEENVKLLASLENVVRNKYAAASVPHSAVMRIQIEQAKLEDRLKALRELRAPLTARLNAALGRAGDDVLPWPKRISEGKISLTDDQLLARLREANPELKALDFQTAGGKGAEDLARKERYPNVAIGLSYIETDDTSRDPITATVSVNLPIWRGSYLAKEREARARREASVKRRADRERVLVSDLKMAAYRFRDAERKIALYGETLVPKAEQSLKVTRQSFEGGKADVLDLVDAERTLLEFGLSYERARADRAQSLAEIEMLVGRELGTKGGGAQ
jgi:cobalt-zinc-cadmium efflux system outer membrane protein